MDDGNTPTLIFVSKVLSVALKTFGTVKRKRQTPNGVRFAKPHQD